MNRRMQKFDDATAAHELAKDYKENFIKVAILKQIAKNKERRFNKSVKKKNRLKEEYAPFWDEYLARVEETIQQSPALARLTNACDMLARRLEVLGQTGLDVNARTRNLPRELGRLVKSKLKFRRYDPIRL